MHKIRYIEPLNTPRYSVTRGVCFMKSFYASWTAKLYLITCLMPAVSSAAEAYISAEEAWNGLAAEASLLRDIVAETEQRYRDANTPITEALRAKAHWSQRPLYDLLVNELQQRDRNGYRQKQISFAKWSQNFAELSGKMAQGWGTRKSTSQLKDEFYVLHLAYVRSLASVYIYREALKRTYLYEKAIRPLESYDRTDLLDQLEKMDYLAQRSMKWMFYIRMDAKFRPLSSSLYFRDTPCWECSYGKYFHFALPGQRVPEAFYVQANRANNWDRYLVPFAPKEDVAKVQMPEFGQVQSGENQSDSSNNQQIPAPDQGYDESYDRNQNRGSDIPEPADSRQQPQSEEPDAVKNDAELQKHILRLQALLESPQVQQDAELRKSIEDTLKRIRPNLPKLKPAPPEPPKEKEKEEKKDPLV